MTAPRGLAGTLRPARGERREAAALALACIALALAAVGALAPSVPQKGVYDWPASTPTGAMPPGGWSGPLLLNRGEAKSITARIPCDEPFPAGSTTALSTAATGGLTIQVSERLVEMQAGSDYLGAYSLGDLGTAPPGCAFVLGTSGRTWSLTGGPSDVQTGGQLAAAPRVTALRSSLDLRRPGLSRSSSKPSGRTRGRVCCSC